MKITKKKGISFRYAFKWKAAHTTKNKTLILHSVQENDIYTCCLILSSAFWEISSVREVIWSFASTIKDTNNIIIKWNHFAKPKFKVQKYLFCSCFSWEKPSSSPKDGGQLPPIPTLCDFEVIYFHLLKLFLLLL